ncbi:hypothetical protein CapIbe_008115 [Capra ibex]
MGPGLSKADSALHVWRSKLRSRAVPKGSDCPTQRSGGAGSAAAAEIFWRSSRGGRGARSCRLGVRLTRVDVCRVRERENEPRGELVRARPWASPDPGQQREKSDPRSTCPAAEFRPTAPLGGGKKCSYRVQSRVCVSGIVHNSPSGKGPGGPQTHGDPRAT